MSDIDYGPDHIEYEDTWAPRSGKPIQRWRNVSHEGRVLAERERRARLAAR
jgi:hypothetical protein